MPTSLIQLRMAGIILGDSAKKPVRKNDNPVTHRANRTGICFKSPLYSFLHMNKHSENKLKYVKILLPVRANRSNHIYKAAISTTPYS